MRLRTLFWHKWEKSRPISGRKILFTIDGGKTIHSGEVDWDGTIFDDNGHAWRYCIQKWKHA